MATMIDIPSVPYLSVDTYPEGSTVSYFKGVYRATRDVPAGVRPTNANAHFWEYVGSIHSQQ